MNSPENPIPIRPPIKLNVNDRVWACVECAGGDPEIGDAQRCPACYGTGLIFEGDVQPSAIASRGHLVGLVAWIPEVPGFGKVMIAAAQSPTPA